MMDIIMWTMMLMVGVPIGIFLTVIVGAVIYFVVALPCYIFYEVFINRED